MTRIVPSVLILLLAACLAPAQSTPSLKITRLDPRLDALVSVDAKPEKIASGYTWVEGPVWDRKNGYLLFSEIPSNSIMKWQAGKGASLFLKPSGYTGKEPFTGREPGSNGLTFDAKGHLVMCEHGDRRVSRLEADGHKTTLADHYDGKRLNSPNDLAYRSNGDLYFTDPAFGLPKTFDDPHREIDFCGVYRVTPDGKVTLMTKEVAIPNGIAFSPDEKTLYVTDVSDHPAWYAFDVKADGTLANKRMFFDALPLSKAHAGAPDGLKVDAHGNLFASGPGGVYIIAPDGTLLGSIDLGVTSNIAFGEDGSTLFVTANTDVYRVRLKTKGRGY